MSCIEYETFPTLSKHFKRTSSFKKNKKDTYINILKTNNRFENQISSITAYSQKDTPILLYSSEYDVYICIYICIYVHTYKYKNICT